MDKLLVALCVGFLFLSVSPSIDASHSAPTNDGTCLQKAKDLMSDVRNGTQPFGLSQDEAAHRAAAYYLLDVVDESCDF